MPDPVGPKFIPKAALTVGRVVHQPFEVPTEMTKSALLSGGVTHTLIGEATKAASKAITDLEPRGPAKLIEKLFGKVDDALVHSAGQAKTATETFWVPFSNGAHQIGDAVSNPFSLYYANRAGFEIPAEPADAQKFLAIDILHAGDDQSTKFPGFKFPVPAPPAEEPPAGEKPGDGGETGDGGKTGDGGETGDGGKTGDGGAGGETGGDGGAGGETKTDAGGDAGTTVATTTTPEAGDVATTSEPAVDPAATETAGTEAGPRSLAPASDVPTEVVTEPAAQAPVVASSGPHPAGIDPKLIDAAAAASVVTTNPELFSAPAADAAAGAEATAPAAAPVVEPPTDAAVTAPTE